MIHEVAKEHWQTTARAVKNIKDEQSEAFDLACFVIENGKPGLSKIF